MVSLNKCAKGSTVLIAPFRGVICVLFILLIPRTGNAAEWSAQPSVRLSEEHSDNINLTPQPHHSVTGSMFSPRLDLGVISDIWQITGGMEAVEKRYPGDSELNKDDRNYNLTTSYRTERSSWQLGGAVLKNSTLANDQIGPNTGLVEVQKVYDEHSVNPSWTWTMNELTRLQLAYSFDSVSFVNGQSAGLNDYSTRSVSAQLTNQRDPKNQIFLTAGYSIFQVPSTAFESKSATYQIGMTQAVSETMNWTLAGGGRKTSSEQTTPVCTLSFGPFCLQIAKETQSSKDSSSVFNGSLAKQYEVTQVQAAFSRAFDPSGLGGQVRTDSQNVSLNRLLAPRLTGNLSVSNYNYKSETGNLSGVNRHLYVFQTGLHWMWTEKLSTDLSYQYMHIKREQEDKPTSSNAAYLLLRYGWSKMSVSR